MKKIVPAIMVALAIVSAMFCQPAVAVENKRDQGIKLYNAKNFKDAGRLLDEHLTVYPQDIYALYYDALACQGLGNMGKAKIYYRQVATLAPNHQLGGYAKSVLRQIDPSFVAAASTSSSAFGGSPGPSNNMTIAPAGVPTLDNSIPMEWDVNCAPDEHGVVWVDAAINGRNVKMVFDTGAPGVVIGKNQMAEIGLEPPKGPSTGETGGSSSTEKVKCWVLPMNVKVGQVERKVLVQVLETNQSEPLLGQTYAGLFECTVDPGAKRIHFKQRGYSKGATRNAYEVPYVFVPAGNRIIVNIEVNGKTGPAIFDSGNTSSGIKFLNLDQAKKFGLSIPADADNVMSVGITGSSSNKSFPVRRVRLGPIDRTDLLVTVGAIPDEEGYPLLGQPFWQGYEYTINRQKKVIEFVRR